MCENHKNISENSEVEIINASKKPTKKLIMNVPGFDKIIKDNATNEQVEFFAESLANALNNRGEDK